MNLTVASPPPTPQPSDTFTKERPAPRCQNCGTDAPQRNDAEAALAAAQSHIADLEAQVRQLNEKATAAIYRCAAYEEDLARLRAARSPSPAGSPPPHSPLTPRSPAQRASPPTGFLSSSPRLSSLLSPRKSSPNLRGREAPEAGEDLAAELARERALRLEAEDTVRRTGEEAEELSAAVFERANEMVAGERRERAGLEERVLELEAREKGRGRRLEILEGAVERLERVRALFEEEREREREKMNARAKLIAENAAKRGKEAAERGEARWVRPTSKDMMQLHLGSPSKEDKQGS